MVCWNCILQSSLFNCFLTKDIPGLGQKKFVGQVEEVGYVPIDTQELNRRYGSDSNQIMQLLYATLAFSHQNRMNASDLLKLDIFRKYNYSQLNNFIGSDLTSTQPINKDIKYYEACIGFYMDGNIEKCKQVCIASIQSNGSEYIKSFNLFCLKIKLALYEEDYGSAEMDIKNFHKYSSQLKDDEKLIIYSLNLYYFCKTKNLKLDPKIIEYLWNSYKICSENSKLLSYDNFLFLCHSLLLYYGFEVMIIRIQIRM